MAALAYPYVRPSTPRRRATKATRIAGGGRDHLRIVTDEALAAQRVPTTRLVPAGQRAPGQRVAAARHAPAARHVPTGRRAPARARRATAPARPRRLLTGIVVFGALLGAWLGAGALAGAGSGQHDVRLPGSTPVRGGFAYVVRPGDTLWSIATRVDPSGDPRPIVDRLSAEVRGTRLEPGSVIVVP